MPEQPPAVVMRADTAFRVLPSAQLVAQAEQLRAKPAPLEATGGRRLSWFGLGVCACFALLAVAGTQTKPADPPGAIAAVKSAPFPVASARDETRIVVEPVPAVSVVAPDDSRLYSAKQRAAVTPTPTARMPQPAIAPTSRSAFDEPLAPPE
jgi:hypothetical protein